MGKGEGLPRTRSELHRSCAQHLAQKVCYPPAYVRFSLYFVSCNTLYVPPAPDRGLTNVHSRASTESASAQRMRCTRPGRFLEGAT